VFIVTLRVEDPNGHVVLDERIVRVRSASGSVADAGKDFTVDQNDPARFNATASTEGLIDWTWEFVDHDRIVRLDGPTPTYVFTDPGEFVVALNVIDIDGMSYQDSVQVHVRDTKPPVATCLLDTEINQDETLLLDGSPSTDNDHIEEWTWIFLYDGQTVVLNGEMQRFSFSIPGMYQIFLFVEDGAGNRAETNLTLEVLDITAPVANAGPPQTVSQHETVSLDGSGSTDNVAVVNWTWRYVYQRRVYEVYGSYPSLVFDKAGVIRITLFVSDGAGLEDTHDTVITVEDHRKPIADAGPDLEIAEGDIAFFNGMNSSDDGGVITWEWSFEYNDQTILFEGRLASFVFNVRGEYVVTLLVKDYAGNEDSDTVLVKVEESPEPTGTPWAWIVAAVAMVALLMLITRMLILPRLKGGG
jgi:PKD repeat protein